MSTEAMAYMFGPGKDMGGENGLTPAEMLVGLSHANHARKDGTRSFPSTDTVMEETRLSRSSVIRARSQLVAKGVLRLEEGGKGTKRVGRYCFPGVIAAATLARAATVTPLDAAREGRGATQELSKGVITTPLDAFGGVNVNDKGATTKPRGVTVTRRGVTTAPKPSLTVNEPSEEPTSSHARDTAPLTFIQPIGELDPDERACLEQELAELEDEEEAARAFRAAETERRWEQRQKADWEKTAARAGPMTPARLRHEAAG